MSWINALSPTERAEYDHDRATLLERLDYVRAHAVSDSAGLYGPQSLSWCMFREPTIMAIGFSAVLLQVAHPAVANGVERNSIFRDNFLVRARSTYTSLYQIIFGTLDDACAAARRMHSMHARVRGVIPADLPTPEAGRAFRANEPDLLRWVWATLVDTGARWQQMLAGPFTPAQRAQHYAEARLTGALLGVPDAFLPPTRADFDTYYQGMLDGPTIVVGPEALGQAQTLLNLPYFPGRLDDLIATALIPPKLREQYHLRWGPRQEKHFAQLVGLFRLYRRVVPLSLRAAPAYHQACLRLAQAEGRRAPLIAHAVNSLDRRVNLPFSIKPIAPREAD